MAHVAESSNVEAARDALARYAWQEAYALLKDAPEEELAPSDWDGLAEAAWWSGRMDDCIDARERAYRSYLDRGDEVKAAAAAMHLAKNYGATGQNALAMGWRRRAERMLERREECLEHGYLALDRSLAAFGSDHDVAFEQAERAMEIALSHGDRGLAARAIFQQGDVLMRQGKVEEGIALMDEATAAAVSGELDPMSTATIYCWTISTCRDLADYRRAGEWTDAAKRWCDRQAIAGFPGICRVYRAEIMRLRGAWSDAEREARLAADELRAFSAHSAGEAFYEIGEIRLRSGDAAGALDAFEQASELGRNPQPGLALLRLEEGNVDAAVRCLRSALEDETDPLARARLLPALVQATLAADDRVSAEEAAQELGEVARQFSTAGLDAVLHATRGRVLLAAGEAAQAVRELRRAQRAWEEINAPYEAAEVRVLLAGALASDGYDEDARLHLQAAFAALEKLGALSAARAVRELLAEPPAMAGAAEQARATFMFTDIVESTNLVDAIGDEAWQDLLRWHDATLRTLFARHGGEEVDKAGDGFFVAFPSPQAALACAVDVQRTLQAHRRSHGFAPQVRVGLHATEALRGGRGWRGRGVHVAARIAALGKGGQIVASAATLRAAAAAVAETWEANLKGVAEPVEVGTAAWI